MEIVGIIAIVALILYFVNKKTHFFTPGVDYKSNPEGFQTIEDKYNSQKVAKEEELNLLLEKINKKGLDKLSNKERQRLEELSR